MLAFWEVFKVTLYALTSVSGLVFFACVLPGFAIPVPVRWLNQSDEVTVAEATFATALFGSLYFLIIFGAMTAAVIWLDPRITPALAGR